MITNVYYRQQKLNSGGMCDIFLMTRESDGLSVAGKFPKPQYVRHFEFRQRFIREGGLCRSLHRPFPNPHVIRLVDCNLTGEGEFLAFELMENSLFGRLEEGIGDEEKYVAILHAARGLRHLHAHGVVHRDVKPSNILRAHDGTYKVADLGCAKTAGPGLNLTVATLGTPEYMAPEQRSPQVYADAISDVFGLGATIHHAYFGGPPTYDEKTSLVHLSPDVRQADPAFLNILAKTLHPDRAQRFSSMDEFIAEWERLHDLGVIRTPQPEANGPGLGEILLTGAAIAGIGLGLAAALKAIFGGKN